MPFTLKTCFYGEPSITDEVGDSIDDALDAWQDATWAALTAPRAVAGDILCLVLRDPAGKIIRNRNYAPGA